MLLDEEYKDLLDRKSKDCHDEIDNNVCRNVVLNFLDNYPLATFIAFVFSYYPEVINKFIEWSNEDE